MRPSLFLVALATCCWMPDLSAQTELARLLVDDASSFANYGSAVAVDGDVVVVGASDDAVPANYTGSVYVFRDNGGAWSEEAKLTASDGKAQDVFGRSVAVDGDVLVVGAPAPLNSSEIGAAYVFRFDGTNWVEEQKLQQTTGGSNDWFGWDVDLDGTRLVVGAMYSNSAWVFEYDGVQWNLTQKLVPSDATGGDLFGSQVCLQGDDLLVSAHGEGDNALGMYYIGAVYAFSYNGTKWVETQKVRASDESDQSSFGQAMAMDQGVAVVGSPGKKTGAWGSGKVYVLRQAGGVWAEEDNFSPPWPSTYSRFGKSVAISGDLILVANEGRDMENQFYGAAFPFRHDGVKWQEEPSFTGSQSKKWDLFGDRLALDGNTAVAGGYEDTVNPWADGAAYVFDVSPWFHLMVQPMPLESMDDGKFLVRNGMPGMPTALFFAVTDPARFYLAAIKNADGTGSVKWEWPIPAAAQGLELWFLAIQPGILTNLLSSDVL